MNHTLKRTLLIITLIVTVSNSIAQVGIGTVNPNDSVILAIDSQTKGILIPQIGETSEVLKKNGSLIYDVNAKKFKVCLDGKWISVNPLDADEIDNVTAKSNLTVTNQFTVNGGTVDLPNATVVSAPKSTITANTFVGNGTIPVGGIIMWSGDTASLPDNWQLCDGTKGTPNLSGRFIVAGYNSSNPNTVEVGGNNQITLTNDNLPTHSHGVNILSNPAGRHTHAYQTHDDNGSSGYSFRAAGGGGRANTAGYSITNDVLGNEVRTDITGTGYISSDNNNIYETPSHQHNVIGDTKKTGGEYTSASHVNPPPFIPGCTPVYRTYFTDGSYVEDTYCYTEDPKKTVDYCITVNDCIDNSHNPSYPVGYTIIDSESWSVKPIDIRPTYYVLAFIMRIQ